MFLRNQFSQFFLLIVLLGACSKNNSLSDITSCDSIYIVKSEACGLLNGTSVELRPYAAKMTIDKKGGEVYDITILYDFLNKESHSKISFFIPSVPGSVADKQYSFNGEHIKGHCSVGNGTTYDYEDICVKGTIGLNMKSDLSIAGNIKEKAFKINVLMLSGNNPGSMVPDEETLVQSLDYEEYSFTNASGIACDLAFKIEDFGYFNQKNSRCSLADGERRSLGFLTDNGFWMTTCSGLEISFKDGTKASYSGAELIMMSPGSQNGRLKYLGVEVDRYIGADGAVGRIEPRPYVRYLYEICRPSASLPGLNLMR